MFTCPSFFLVLATGKLDFGEEENCSEKDKVEGIGNAKEFHCARKAKKTGNKEGPSHRWVEQRMWIGSPEKA